MKVKIGETVITDFGEGPIIAMTNEWCIFLRNPKAPPGKREIAVPWDQVSLPAEAAEVASALTEKEV